MHISTEKTLILGIDPGFTGALAVLSPKNTLVDLIDMPLISTQSLFKGGKLQREIDAKSVAAFILKHKDHIRMAIVEKVTAAPDQGVVSMFRFGEGLGILRGCLATLQIRAIFPPPSVWKASMNLNSDKNYSISRARDLVGKTGDHLLTLKKHDGRAEAILLAAFGLRQFI